MPTLAGLRRAATYIAGATCAPALVDGPEGDAAATHCPSCGAARPARFCSECGERRVDPDDYRLRHFAAHAVDQLFNLDGTLWRTVRALVTRPGLLTAEYLAGRRTRYTRPLQLFLLVWVRTVVAGMLLLVLAARAVLSPLRGRAPELAHALARGVNAVVNSEAVLGLLIVGAVAAYLVVALRRVYPEALRWTVVRATVLALAMPWFAALYRDLLFAIAYFSV